MRTMKIALAGAVAVLAGSAGLVSLSSASDEPLKLTSKGVTIESVSERDAGYALGLTRSVELGRFVDEAVAGVAPEPSTQMDHGSVTAGDFLDQSQLPDQFETASIELPPEEIDSQSFEAGSPQVDLDAYAVVPVPTARPASTRVAAAPRAVRAPAAAPRPVVAERRSVPRTLSVASTQSGKRVLSTPVPLVNGAFR